MRNLTIRRTKSFVACLVKMKVYIEDYTAYDLVINNVPCRKIGVLKNGEEKTFSIDNAEARVYVIADRVSKSYCNEYYKLPEGEEDIVLSGKNKFNLATGNAFRFDGVTDEEVLQNRKKATKKGALILVAAAVIGLIAGFILGFASSRFSSSSTGEPKDFASDGIKITMTDEFRKADMDGFTVCYESQDVAVFVTQETFAQYNELKNYTLQQYGELLIENNEYSIPGGLQSSDGLTFFEYQYFNSSTNVTYSYFTYIYETSDAFWIVQFATAEENVEDCRQSITDWAKSVEFSNEF